MGLTGFGETATTSVGAGELGVCVSIGEASDTFMSDTFSFDVGCCSFCGVVGFGFFAGDCSTGAGVGDSLRLALMATVGGSCSLVLDTLISDTNTVDVSSLDVSVLCV